MRKLSILAAALLIAPMTSQAKTLDELLAEKGIVAKGASVGGSAAKVSWDKGTRVDFPDTGFTTNISTTIQTRYTFNDGDTDVGNPNTSSFDTNLARLNVSGSALNKEFDYKLMFDLVSSSNAGDKSPSLLDAYLTWHPCDNGWLRMGQFKTGISRQYNTPDEKLQFADRSMVSGTFDLGRQSGLSGGMMFMDNKLSLEAAAFNGSSDGEGLNRSGNDTRHTGVINARYNLMGEMDAYSESDVEWTEDAAMSMGLAYAYEDNQDAGLEFVHQSTVSADVNFKMRGISVNGEFFYTDINPELAGASSSNPFGFYVQGGYFVIPKKFEVAARYGYTDSDDDASIIAGNDKLSEVAVSMNYYWWQHHLKAQFGYFVDSYDAQTGGTDETDSRWMLQLSSR